MFNYCHNVPPRSCVRMLLPAICLAAGLGTVIASAGDVQWRAGTVPIEVRTPAEVASDLAAVAADVVSGEAPHHVLVQFNRPLMDAERSSLASDGLQLLGYVGGNAYFAALDAPRLNVAAIANTPTLSAVKEIQTSWKLHPKLLRGEFPAWTTAGLGTTADGRQMVAVYVMFHRDIDLATIGLDVAAGHGANVRDLLESVNSLVVEMPDDSVALLAADDAVQWIEPALPKFSECNDSNRSRVQADIVQAAPYNLDGSGINVLVYDGGTVRSSHDDFGGRVSVRDSSGMADHSTHVAGTIGGSGAASGGTYRGMAPAVTMQSYGFEWDSSGVFLYDNPGDIESDYSQAINSYNVDIANNSIGTNTTLYWDCDITGDYGITSALIDNIVRGSVSGGEPFRIIWAAGNERQSDRCGDTYYTTAPPAGAKNHITVGALNSNNDSMTSFSSWGPTDDGRLKPDISAAGCQSNDDNGVTSCSSSGDSSYTVKCGTSMACPTVTGMCALLLEDYRDQFPGLDDPRNSTLKILLAHTAIDRGNTGPDYQFGYGSVRIQDAIDYMRLEHFTEDQVSQSGTITYEIQVNGGEGQLKVTLAWDDPAGTPNVNPALVNDLDLRVFDPSMSQRYPWTLDPSDPGATAVRTQADHLNNIEQVLVDNPTSGTWTVQIYGYNVPDGPQAYSLCASPRLGGEGPGDCNNNGIPDDQDLANCDGSPWCSDCNGNGTLDECDITFGTSGDCNANGTPDECEPGGGLDCNGNGVPDFCDILDGTSTDCNGNGVPDECEMTPAEVVISFDMSSDPGWSTDGLWAYGQPTGDGGEYGNPDPTSGHTGNNVYGYNLNGDYENSLSEQHLDSTAIDCSSMSDVTLSFWRWLNVERSTYDHAYIRASNNGSSWTTIFSNPDSHIEDGSWTYQEYDISSIADGQPTVYLRWTMGETDSSWQFSGWNIDDVEIRGTSLSGGTGDCNGNGIFDACDILNGTSEDCNNNDVPDECDIADGTSQDNNGNGIPDECESIIDCNDNGVPDDQDIADGTSQDCNVNGVPDECDIADGTSQDCNGTGVPDECELSGNDCNANGIPDDCELTGNDCNANGIPDDCELSGNDCNDNGVPDECDIASGTSNDVNDNGIPDECETDCNDNGVPDDQDIADSTSQDCNTNGIPDECDIADGTSQDANGNGIPDECESDCNGNGVPDDQDIIDGTSEDCNANGVPDECDLDSGTSEDCNDNAVPDECEVAGGGGLSGTYYDNMDFTGIRRGRVDATIDFQWGTGGPWPGFGSDSFAIRWQGYVLSTTQAGTYTFYTTTDDGVRLWVAGGLIIDRWIDQGPTEWSGTISLEANREYTLVLEYYENGGGAVAELRWQPPGQAKALIPTGNLIPALDCNGNGVPDDCELAGNDCNANGIPDDCELAGNDCNSNSVPDECDLADGTSQDCNANGVPDECDIADGTSQDCNTNGVPDECELSGNDCNANGIPDDCELVGNDCNSNSVPDECDIADGTSMDCNANAVPDECDIADGTSPDCNLNGVPDECELVDNDCNTNGVPDECDIADGTSNDANGNGIPDECEADCNQNGIPDDQDIADGTSMDCNTNAVPDECDIADGTSPDCNLNGVPDECELVDNDCNANGVPDECDIADGTSNDANGNGIPDECEADCNQNGIPDDQDIADGTSMDCNTNAVPDECDIADGTSPDCNLNGVPDECELVDNDCNANGVPDECDIADGTSNDANGNGIPDECEADCNQNGIPDDQDIADGTSMDCNTNAVPDECDIADGTSPDCNLNGVPDECELVDNDCNANGVPDECDIADGTSNDANGNGIPDECEADCNQNGIPDDQDIADGTSMDCNTNAVPDECDIADGTSPDCNLNGVPDECELVDNDCNANGVPDECDIADGTSNDANGNGIPDECEADCNQNGIPDDQDIADGTSMDCNTNAVPDECDIADGTSPDCNLNGVPDECELVDNDCNANGCAR